MTDENTTEEMPEHMRQDFVEVFEDMLCAFYLAHGALADPTALEPEKYQEVVEGVAKRVKVLQIMLDVSDVPELIRTRLLMQAAPEGEA